MDNIRTDADARARLNRNIPGWRAYVLENIHQDENPGAYVGMLSQVHGDGSLKAYGNTRADVCSSLEAQHFKWMTEHAEKKS